MTSSGSGWTEELLLPEREELKKISIKMNKLHKKLEILTNVPYKYSRPMEDETTRHGIPNNSSTRRYSTIPSRQNSEYLYCKHSHLNDPFLEKKMKKGLKTSVVLSNQKNVKKSKPSLHGGKLDCLIQDALNQRVVQVLRKLQKEELNHRIEAEVQRLYRMELEGLNSVVVPVNRKNENSQGPSPPPYTLSPTMSSTSCPSFDQETNLVNGHHENLERKKLKDVKSPENEMDSIEDLHEDILERNPSIQKVEITSSPQDVGIQTQDSLYNTPREDRFNKIPKSEITTTTTTTSLSYASSNQYHHNSLFSDVFAFQTKLAETVEQLNSTVKQRECLLKSFSKMDDTFEENEEDSFEISRHPSIPPRRRRLFTPEPIEGPKKLPKTPEPNSIQIVCHHDSVYKKKEVRFVDSDSFDEFRKSLQQNLQEEMDHSSKIYTTPQDKRSQLTLKLQELSAQFTLELSNDTLLNNRERFEKFENEIEEIRNEINQLDCHDRHDEGRQVHVIPIQDT